MGPHTHRRAHHVAQAKVETALLIHGVVQPRQLGQRRPVMGEGVIPQTVVGAMGDMLVWLAASSGPTPPPPTAQPQLCCLTFQAGSLFLGVSYQDPGLCTDQDGCLALGPRPKGRAELRCTASLLPLPEYNLG